MIMIIIETVIVVIIIIIMKHQLQNSAIPNLTNDIYSAGVKPRRHR